MTISRRSAVLAVVASVVAAGPAFAQVERGRWRQRRHRPANGASGMPHVRTPVGPDPLQFYDLYGGEADGSILAFIHGGGWSRGDATMVHALPDYARRHGLSLASISYRLVPDVTPREQAQDVAAAVAHLRRHFPGRRIVLLGHSAGAHLAALVGVDAAYLDAVGLAPADLAGVILLDGAGYDATGDRGGGFSGRVLNRLYADAFGDQAAALSPTLLVRAGRAYPPFLIFHIESRADSRDQSQGLAEALRAAGGHAEVVVAPADSHRDINVEFGVAGDAEGERAARFIAGG
ncbi:alpha/beta hydrolase [Brevundimonas sp.]|uniref:alpha/beta hydrolase n=1 Tax=Brevundimonas sp. TaxID=1871086 RepID=UPI00286D3399|nr:alpha/beta hydrolase [Brevundimonas sp.]